MRRAKTKGKRFYDLSFVFYGNGSKEAIELGKFLEQVLGKHRIVNFYCDERVNGREIKGVLLKYSEGSEIRLECPDGSFWTGRDRIINVVERMVLKGTGDKRKIERVARFREAMRKTEP